jgi:tetratricopeptide (TPR) repeat protein
MSVDLDYEGMSKEEAEESRRYYEDAYVNMSMRDPHRIDLAIEALRKDLELRYRSQERQHKRIHKGKPYYNLGYCFLHEGKLDYSQAAYNLVLAYIEDLLSAADFPETAESLGAARALRQGLQFDPEVLREIRREMPDLEELVDIDDLDELMDAPDPLDPRSILRQVMKKLSINEASLGGLCRQKIQIPRKEILSINWSKRVFVGGNYSANFGALLKMKQLLLRKGLEPVVADDYLYPQGLTNREFCLMLLHTCTYAICDVTVAGGQFVEIERSRDYGVEPLVVFNASSLERDRPLTSGMSMVEYEPTPYKDPETDLEPLIEKYLKDNP